MKVFDEDLQCWVADGVPGRTVGPGTVLSNILHNFRIPTCGECGRMLKKMDEWGVGGCLEHREEIIAHLVAQAEAREWIRFLPFKEFGAEGLLNRALASASR